MHMHTRAHSIALCLAHSVSRTQHVIARAWSPCKAREHRASTHAHTHTSNALRSTQDRGLGLWFKSARILAVRCVPPSRRLFDLVRHARQQMHTSSATCHPPEGRRNSALNPSTPWYWTEPCSPLRTHPLDKNWSASTRYLVPDLPNSWLFLLSVSVHPAEDGSARCWKLGGRGAWVQARETENGRQEDSCSLRASARHACVCVCLCASVSACAHWIRYPRNLP
jgi:hypothetical protein